MLLVFLILRLKDSDSYPYCFLVATKADVDEKKRGFSPAEGQALADSFGWKYFETSAKEGTGVSELFDGIAAMTTQLQIDQMLQARKFNKRRSAKTCEIL